MFIIASTGRCGTQAICHGLHEFSDHTVAHEPAPRLLHEAYLKHRQMDYRTPTLEARLEFFREKSRQPYGESFRAPNLLPEIRAVAPQTRFLIIIRNPLQYVRSAHSMRVFRKGGEWDETRILPHGLGGSFDQLPLAEKIAWHWVALNRHLLDFAAADHPGVKVAILRELETDLPQWADFLNVKIRDPDGLGRYLQKRPNAATSSELPNGFDENGLAAICRTEWERAQNLEKMHAAGSPEKTRK